MCIICALFGIITLGKWRPEWDFKFFTWSEELADRLVLKIRGKKNHD